MTTLQIPRIKKQVDIENFEFPNEVVKIAENAKFTVFKKYLSLRSDLEEAIRGIKQGHFEIFSPEKTMKKFYARIAEIN